MKDILFYIITLVSLFWYLSSCILAVYERDIKRAWQTVGSLVFYCLVLALYAITPGGQFK